MKQLAIIGVGMLAMAAQAATTHVENNGTATFLELSRGPDVSKFGVGLGIKPDNNRPGFGGLYFSQTEFKNTSESYGQSNATIQTLGIRGFSIQGADDEEVGADMTLGLSHTKVQDYQRTGLSAKATVYLPVINRVTWYLGLALRPTFLSIDWDPDILTEVGFDTGIDVRLLPNLGLNTYYYHESMLTNDLESRNLSSGVAMGINWVW
ncbi:hypothetical protein DN730_16520 [Marinomonas piezotolerans]|uniref:Outer membrane protein beta-barrel domain-containing protein n=1 Tax=Marinomonas piezotolerans TaxID=2213058 RepID=A0A370U5N4_9GAMM|nr:hypothetical protein [Marinomonas piezotolerans]RDL43100.1 hypothetical protein DN730_16520 [Marinomonas piezotolerans]